MAGSFLRAIFLIKLKLVLNVENLLSSLLNRFVLEGPGVIHLDCYWVQIAVRSDLNGLGSIFLDIVRLLLDY